MDEVELIRYFAEPILLWLAGTVMGDLGAHMIFHRAGISAICWNGYGMLLLLLLAVIATGLRYFTEQALLLLSGTVMDEVAARMVFQGFQH